MIDHSVSTSETVELLPERDGRLVPYLLIGLGGLALAIVAGFPAFAALAAPFLVALMLGLRRTGAIVVSGRMRVDASQVLEGDVIEGTVSLEWEGELDAWVILDRLKGVRTDDAEPEAEPVSRYRRGVRSVELPVRLRASQWGLHALGDVWIRLRAPFGLVSWTGKIVTAPSVRVLPSTETLNRLLEPPQSRVVWGMHRSRRLGDGHDFAELRPYAPGDRLRDLNWAATARLRQPFVNRHHPELSGDVLITVDAFDDGTAGAVSALAQSARLAWALAYSHALANDRVGLAGLGGSTQWLPPTGGRLARYQLLEALLRVGGEAADRVTLSRDRGAWPPTTSLVIVLSTLHDRLTLDILRRWRAAGRSIAVVAIDMGTDGDPEEPTSRSLARRLWKLELERRRRSLRELGIPVVDAPASGSVRPVVSALATARRAARLRQGVSA